MTLLNDLYIVQNKFVKIYLTATQYIWYYIVFALYMVDITAILLQSN